MTAKAEAAIGKLGTHSLRHNYRSWLDAVSTPDWVQQKVKRHSDIRTTTNVYGDVVTDEMVQAHSKVVGWLSITSIATGGWYLRDVPTSRQTCRLRARSVQAAIFALRFPSPKNAAVHLTDYKKTWHGVAKDAGLFDRQVHDLWVTFANRANGCRVRSDSGAHDWVTRLLKYLTYLRETSRWDTKTVIKALDPPCTGYTDGVHPLDSSISA